MTPEELEDFIAQGNPVALVDAVSDLSEAERKKLSKHAQTIHRTLEREWWRQQESDDPLLKRILGNQRKNPMSPWKHFYTAGLALLAVGPCSQAKKARLRSAEDPGEDLVFRVLKDRRPDWADDWLASKFEEGAAGLEWDTMLRLLDDGICRKPDTDDYYRSLAQGLQSWCYQKREEGVTLSKYLVERKDLLEDTWKFFEVETDALVYDWLENESEVEGWQTAFVKLSNEGHLDRGRLLRATLDGLTTGFKQNLLSCYAKLHERLAPSPDELVELQDTYCDLLSSHLPQTVSFAVRMIKQLDKAKRLDDARFVPASASVFHVSTKGPPKTVIGLLKKIAKRQPDLVSDIGRTLLDGLRHPSEDVQAAALDLLGTLGEQLDDDVLRGIAECREDLPAMLHGTVSQILAERGAEDPATAPDPREEIQDREQQQLELKSRAEAIAEPWRSRAGVDDAFAAAEQTAWPPALPFTPLEAAPLTGLDPVLPIQDVDELLDAIAHAIEQIESTIEIERIIDGVSRLPLDELPDHERRSAPLIKRIQKIKDSDSNRGITSRWHGPTELSRLICFWLSGKPNLAKPSWSGRDNAPSPLWFIDARLEPVQGRLQRGLRQCQLDFPTHQRGWIDPREFVRRWAELESSEGEISGWEVIQGLLRLAPEGREQALEEAASLEHAFAAPLRWALGGDEGPEPASSVKQKIDLVKNKLLNKTPEAPSPAALWLAAARSRDPNGSFPELKAAGLADSGPDAIEPAVYNWSTGVRFHKDSYSDTTYRFSELELQVQPPLDDKPTPAAHPTVLLHRNEGSWSPFGVSSPWIADWISLVWPARLEGFFATGVKCLHSRIDDASSNWEPNHIYFQPLFDPDRPITPMAAFCLALGLSGRDQDARGLAVDALVEAIHDGCAHPDQLGDVLETMVEPYWLKLNRLCENLAEVARVSPLHAWFVHSAATRLLTAYDELPRDAHLLLALLLELHAQLGLPVSDEVAQQLKPIKGSSKTAKLAKSLREFEPAAGGTLPEAQLQLLEARIARAERWSSAQ